LVKKITQATLALFIGLAFAGVWLSLQERHGVETTRLRRLFETGVIHAEDPVELTGVLARPPEPAPGGAFFLDFEAESLRTENTILAASGTVRLFISPGDDEAEDEFKHLALDTGARLRVLVRLERARRYSNPGSPDFNDFLERRGYDLKGTIKSLLLIEPLGKAKSNRLLAWLYGLRIKLMNAIDARFRAPTSGTLKAMLAGNRYFLDAEVSERLRESATFHTLVIAGLHMGILAWALLRVRWDFWRRGRRETQRRGVARTLAAILLLWAYAAMVGLAPPVVRAATMLTIGVIAPLLFRRAASINTVSLAAFVILALKPALVADPAFQLSFAAVAAIVALALPLIDRLRQIGAWRPTARAPHPPACPPLVRAFAEILFWDEREFRRDSRRSPIRYRLEKSAAARRLNRLRLQPLARAIVLLVITSMAIQLATLPLMAVYFNRVSPIGILLNVTAGLLTAVLMLGGLAVLAVAPLSAPLAAMIAGMVNAAHALLVQAIVPFEGVTFATFRVAHYEDWHAVIYALYFVPLAGFAVWLDRWRPVDEFFPVERPIAPPRRRVPVSLCLVALLISMLAIIRPAGIAPTGKLTVYFLDVGQGDSALIVFPHGTTMLVDAGGELPVGKVAKEEAATDEATFNDDGFAVGEAVVSRFLWSQRRTYLNYVLATHADADHIAGFSQVLKNFRVGECLIGHRPTGDFEYDQFASRVSQQRIALGSLAAGERFEIDGVIVEVLWPRRATSLPVTSNNDDSVVLRLLYGSVAILMTGDIEEPAEAALVAAGDELRADVLKVPHHGSKTSSTEAFLDRVRPRCAIISVGERSRFGHPHQVVVERYLSRGIRMFQTGRDGMVTVETDGAGLDVSTYNRNR
ncbi:MAG TPA: ComEC/Rec2 family competence protein, partial [Blastocatellia bacterium]